MSTNRFLISLFIISLGVSLTSLLLGQFSTTFQQYNGVTWWSLGIFVPLSIVMFFGGKMAARSPNKYFFSNLIVHFTILKILFGLGGLILYKKMYQPGTKFFILPFCLVYVVFTIFETIFMLKLSNSKP
jgi:hypothetical protein